MRPTAKPGNSWGSYELYAYNIHIVRETPEQFFGHPLPPGTWNSGHSTSNLEQPGGATWLHLGRGWVLCTSGRWYSLSSRPLLLYERLYCCSFQTHEIWWARATTHHPLIWQDTFWHVWEKSHCQGGHVCYGTGTAKVYFAYSEGSSELYVFSPLYYFQLMYCDVIHRVTWVGPLEIQRLSWLQLLLLHSKSTTNPSL